MKLALLVATLFTVSTLRCFGTSQVPDTIFVDGAVYSLNANPLEQLYKKQKRPSFEDSIEGGSSSANWRGYVAFWEIRNQRLYLIGIDAYLKHKRVLIGALFPERFHDGRVFADWFSGELHIPDGKLLQYVHMGYGSTFERDIIYSIKSGSIIGRTIIDNRRKPLPNEWRKGEEELEKLGRWEKETKHR